MVNGKEALIQHILLYGRDRSWEELANMFSLKTKEIARHTWRSYKKLTNHQEELPVIVLNPVQIEIVNKDQVSFQENTTTNTAEASYIGKEVITLEELMTKAKVDKNKWEVEKYHHTEANGKTTMRVSFKPIKNILNTTSFTEFLKSYQPTSPTVHPKPNTHSNHTCLIFPQQDAHYNKYDAAGTNDITDRFSNIYSKAEKILKQAAAVNYLDKIIYVVGSDGNNSEHTGMTTKGTPQFNILPYHVSFQAICEHEAKMIELLLTYGNTVEVMYVGGNHDEFVSWHVISWLKAYYRKQTNLSFDISTDYTKYVKYSNTAICMNHGDAQKPERLAINFPIEFKQHWSSCDNYYIFTGDKHTELSKSIGGIKFYQVPALSNAHSKWDQKNGYTTTKAEMTVFQIEKDNGMTTIFKEIL